MDKEKQIERKCDNCKRQHTRYCPNSSECISLPNLPYFETDVIRLLEHDWNMHEKKIYELEAENDRLEMKLKQCIDEHSSMCDMNVGLMHDMENMKAENVIKMARLMVGCTDRTCEDCLSQSKKLFGDNKCALIEYAEVLDKAGYRKESEEEINKIIITAKRKLYDVNLESVNLIMGEREKDIKQAWQNGYNKAREEVVKEFAEKVKETLCTGSIAFNDIIIRRIDDLLQYEVEE